MISLKSTQRRMQVFNLRHDIFCRSSGPCGCQERTVTVVDDDPVTGERRPRRIRKKIPASLTLLALEKRDGLSEAVLRLPEVKRAVRRGALRTLSSKKLSAIEPRPKEPAKAK